MGFLYSKADVRPSVPFGTRAVEDRNRRAVTHLAVARSQKRRKRHFGSCKSIQGTKEDLEGTKEDIRYKRILTYQRIITYQRILTYRRFDKIRKKEAALFKAASIYKNRHS